MTQKLTVDTMRMVREIRDRINEETSRMTPDERIAYLRRKGTEANEQFREMAENRAGSRSAPPQS